MSWRVYLRVASVGIPLVVILAIYFAPALVAFVYTGIVALAPLWLPLALAALFAPLWLHFIRSRFVSNIQYVTLELKPGANTPKTARPMELIFYSLYYRTDTTRTSALRKGVIRVPWAFELCATRGIVRFFIHVPVQHRAAIEGRIRAEYRDVDIDEARDYSRERSFNLFESRALMREYSLVKPDPYPLRSYVSHEHSKERRYVFEELLEEVASVGEGEEVWISLMVRPHQRDWPPGLRGFLEMPYDSLHVDAQKEIQKILGSSGDMRHLPQAQQELVKQIESALKKPSFDCGLRVLYCADKGRYSEQRAESLDTLFDRFGDPVLNSLGAYDPSERMSWPLSDIFAVAPALKMEYFLRLFRRRTFFSPPYYGRTFVLNTEELATLYHLPKVGRASVLNRSQSAQLLPPDNLPV